MFMDITPTAPIKASQHRGENTRKLTVHGSYNLLEQDNKENRKAKVSVFTTPIPITSYWSHIPQEKHLDGCEMDQPVQELDQSFPPAGRIVV